MHLSWKSSLSVLLSQAVVLKDCLSAVSAAQLCCSRAIMRCEGPCTDLLGKGLPGMSNFVVTHPRRRARTLWGLLCKVITTSQPLLLMLHCVPRVLFRRRHRQNLTAAAANVVRPTRRHDARRQSISYTLYATHGSRDRHAQFGWQPNACAILLGQYPARSKSTVYTAVLLTTQRCRCAVTALTRKGSERPPV